jgi:hypothetical protein
VEIDLQETLTSRKIFKPPGVTEYELSLTHRALYMATAQIQKYGTNFIFSWNR